MPWIELSTHFRFICRVTVNWFEFRRQKPMSCHLSISYIIKCGRISSQTIAILFSGSQSSEKFKSVWSEIRFLTCGPDFSCLYKTKRASQIQTYPLCAVCSNCLGGVMVHIKTYSSCLNGDVLIRKLQRVASVPFSIFFNRGIQGMNLQSHVHVANFDNDLSVSEKLH